MYKIFAIACLFLLGVAIGVVYAAGSVHVIEAYAENKDIAVEYDSEFLIVTSTDGETVTINGEVWEWDSDAGAFATEFVGGDSGARHRLHIQEGGGFKLEHEITEDWTNPYGPGVTTTHETIAEGDWEKVDK